MNKKKYLIGAVLCCILLLFAAGCVNEPDTEIIGRWTLNVAVTAADGADYWYTWELYPDGAAMQYSYNNTPAASILYPGSWKKEGDVYIFTCSDITEAEIEQEFTLSDGTLKQEESDGEVWMKEEGREMFLDVIREKRTLTSDSPYVGRWKSDTDAEIEGYNYVYPTYLEFFADGTGLSYNYCKNKDTGKYYNTGNYYLMTWETDGNSCEITFMDVKDDAVGKYVYDETTDSVYGVKKDGTHGSRWQRADAEPYQLGGVF